MAWPWRPHRVGGRVGLVTPLPGALGLRRPPAGGLPQRPRTTSPPGVRIEGVRDDGYVIAVGRKPK